MRDFKPALLRQLSALFLLTAASSSLHADSYPAAGGSIEITPLIHSSVQLEYDGTVVLIDPWGQFGLQGAKQADLILVTDSPGHHLDPQAIAELSSDTTSVIITAAGQATMPDGIVMANGEVLRVAGVTVEAVAAYDIIPGAPAHPKGDANGYVVTLGGKKLFFGGVTECVAEVRALEDIDVAFMPLNIPRGRMTPAAAAECTMHLGPDVVYTYHYDQGYIRRASEPDFTGPELPGDISLAQSLDQFEGALKETGIEYRRGNWYPPPN